MTLSMHWRTPSSMLPAAAAGEPGMHTTHFSIIDAASDPRHPSGLGKVQ